MISFIKTTKMTDRSVVATCPLGSSLRGTGLSGAKAARLSSVSPAASLRERSERPTQAPAVAAMAQASYAFALAANGADGGAVNGQKTTQHHPMWAFRGLEPWSDPA